MDYGAALEKRLGRKALAGSNPVPSAIGLMFIKRICLKEFGDNYEQLCQNSGFCAQISR